jgi:hypothetical protein
VGGKQSICAQRSSSKIRLRTSPQLSMRFCILEVLATFSQENLRKCGGTLSSCRGAYLMGTSAGATALQSRPAAGLS